MKYESRKEIKIKASKKEESLDAIDPDEIVQLDETSPTEPTGPSVDEFEEFLTDITTDPVPTSDTEDSPIDASMDDLFAER